MFSVLKGTPATPSKVYYTPFETQPIAPPKLEALVLNKTETSAELVIASDKYAYVEWLIMSRDRAKQYVDFSTNQVIATQEGNLKTLIRNGAEGEDKKTYLDYGKGYAKWNKDMNRYELPYTADLAVAAAKDNRYVLVAFGQMCLQDNKNTPVGSDSAIVVSEPFERKDTKPPKIEDIYKDKRITTDLESYSYSKDSAGDSYDGTLEIIFTEPLFYKEDDKAQPLQLSGTAATDKKEFLQKLFATQLDDYSLFTDDEKKEKFYIDYDKLLKVSTETVEIKEEKVVDGEMTTVVSKVQAVNGVKLRFDNAEDGEILRLNTKLCDADDNMMQSYYLIFEDMEYVPQKEEPTSEADPTGEQRLRMRRKASSWYFDELSET